MSTRWSRDSHASGWVVALSVGIVVTMLFATLGGAAWVLAVELGLLSTGIPGYRDNLIAKIAHVRSMGRGGALEKAQKAVTEVTKELQKDITAPAPARGAPAPVVVRAEPSGLWQLPTLIEGMGSAFTVIVLVIFMLIEQTELRDRLIRLVGYRRLATTTHALDEAGHRISRYLLMQSIINASFGLGIAIGFLLLGVPYALLWGFLAAVLRFIPYVGVWLAALLMIVFALAAFPTWHQPLFVVGVFVLLEALCTLLLEPLLYVQSTKISQVALLCSVAFWAWLWGPVGLLLAVPLTVCLIVFAKHVPGMEFVGILVAEAPPIAPHIAYYQRLLAEDTDEAARIVEEYSKDHPLEAVYDDLILPALGRARRDRRNEQLPEAEERYVWSATREIVLGLHARRHAAKLAADVEGGAGPPETARPSPTGSHARQSGARRGRRAGADHAGTSHRPRVLDDRADLAPAPGLGGHRARGEHATGRDLPGRAPRERPRGPHALPEQAAPGALSRAPDHRGALGVTRRGWHRAAPSRGRGRELRGDDPGRDPRAPADRVRARAGGDDRRDHAVAGPSTSSSIEASTGLVTCRSKPAASARHRSSAWP